MRANVTVAPRPAVRTVPDDPQTDLYVNGHDLFRRGFGFGGVADQPIIRAVEVAQTNGHLAVAYDLADDYVISGNGGSHAVLQAVLPKISLLVGNREIAVSDEAIVSVNRAVAAKGRYAVEIDPSVLGLDGAALTDVAAELVTVAKDDVACVRDTAGSPVAIDQQSLDEVVASMKTNSDGYWDDLKATDLWPSDVADLPALAVSTTGEGSLTYAQCWEANLDPLDPQVWITSFAVDAAGAIREFDYAPKPRRDETVLSEAVILGKRTLEDAEWQPAETVAVPHFFKVGIR